jgi:23S rRNA pseudouridine2605 synthase
MSSIRLQKYLAQCGVASRRKAEEIIDQRRVRVDDKIVAHQGVKVIPGVHTIKVDGKIVTQTKEKIYILLNKPKGYVTTLSDPQGRPVVTSLLNKEITDRVFPVGRLDLDTEGALILTNDGELAQTIQHPSYEINKTYEALVLGIPNTLNMKRLANGIELEGKKTYPAKLDILKKKERSTLIRITIHEGRKRQVRKMFQAIGNPVINLKRIAYGKLYLGNLPLGKYRPLKQQEIKKIFL